MVGKVLGKKTIQSHQNCNTVMVPMEVSGAIYELLQLIFPKPGSYLSFVI